MAYMLKTPGILAWGFPFLLERNIAIRNCVGAATPIMRGNRKTACRDRDHLVGRALRGELNRQHIAAVGLRADHQNRLGLEAQINVIRVI